MQYTASTFIDLCEVMLMLAKLANSEILVCLFWIILTFHKYRNSNYDNISMNIEKKALYYIFSVLFFKIYLIVIEFNSNQSQQTEQQVNTVGSGRKQELRCVSHL